MAESGGYRWAWSIAGRPTAAELATATARYVARFGRFPTLLYVSPQLLADGLQAPMGVQVEADPRLGIGLLAFALPADVADGAAVNGAAALSSVFPLSLIHISEPTRPY